MYTITSDGNSTATGTEYYHRDHLGSVIAITDDTGVMYDAANQPRGTLKSYDVWGKRRNADWSVDDVQGSTSVAGAGSAGADVQGGTNVAVAGSEGATTQYTSIRGHLCYTGQEAITEVGLIHMNGRVYDPQLGRFLSADPHVQYEADLQNYNRYSYVNNNPLKYTDPSGYFIRKLLKSISPSLATGISLVLSVIPGGQWAAAAFNAAYARANGGNFGEIAFSFGIGYIGGRLGQSAAIGAGFKVTSKGLATAGGQAFSSAVSGAFTGAINAVVTDTKLSRGIFQGAATGAAIGAITHAIKSSPEQGTVQADKGIQENRQILLAANADSVEELDALLGPGWELETDVADQGIEDVKRRLFDNKYTGNSELRPLTDWEYSKVISTSDIPGSGTAKKAISKVFKGLKALDVELQRGTRLVQEQVPYIEYSYDVYLNSQTFEPTTHRFNFRNEGFGWRSVGSIQVETTHRICAGGGSVCTR